MADGETVGATTQRLFTSISMAREWHLAMYEGGQPCITNASVHKKKFIGPDGIEAIVCYMQDDDDLPEVEVERALQALDGELVSDLGVDRMPYFHRYEREVQAFEDRYNEYARQLASAVDWKPPPSLETSLGTLLEDIIKPLRALLLLLHAISSSDDNLQQHRLADLEIQPKVEGGGDRTDLVYRSTIISTTPTFGTELRRQERAESKTCWIPLGVDFLKQNPWFSNCSEHQVKFEFDPNGGVKICPPSKGQQASKSKLVPSVGTPPPSRPINNESLYKLIIQVLSYATDMASGACLLTNVMYDHALFRYKRTSSAHHFQVHLLSESRPPDATDSLHFIHLYLYLCDQYMMPHPFFTPLPDVRTDLPPAMSFPSVEGRRRFTLPSWVPLIFTIFSTVMGFFKALTMQTHFVHMLHTIQPSFFMDRVDGRVVLYYQRLRPMLTHTYLSIPLVSRRRSRQAAILEHKDGLFVVKVHADEAQYAAEVRALATLSGVAGVPKLLGTGTTVAGDRFLVMSKVGDALDKDVTDKEAQQIWDSVLKQVHGRGIHHHDLVYHNITRDRNGSFHIIDFGESAAACPETLPCSDREWLFEHKVTH